MEKVIDKLNKSILPLIQEKFDDASLIVLSGSQGRALNQGSKETLDCSDFDFVILYDKLPEKYPCALFSSIVIDFEDGDGLTTIDLKIIDKDYWEELKKVTKQFRRFPFLFRMMSDGYVIKDEHNDFPSFQKEALDFVAEGPDCLSHSELKMALGVVEALEKELNKTSNKASSLAVIFESQFIIGNILLSIHNKWEDLTERTIWMLEQAIPEQNRSFQSALNEYAQGNPDFLLAFLGTMKEVIAAKQEKQTTPDSYKPSYDPKDINVELRNISEKAFFTIMLGQYLERYKAGNSRGDSRFESLKSAIWLTTKKLICYKENRPFQFGNDFIEGCFPEHKIWLQDTIKALETNNPTLLEKTIRYLLRDWGGLHNGE